MVSSPLCSTRLLAFQDPSSLQKSAAASAEHRPVVEIEGFRWSEMKFTRRVSSSNAEGVCCTSMRPNWGLKECQCLLQYYSFL